MNKDKITINSLFDIADYKDGYFVEEELIHDIIIALELLRHNYNKNICKINYLSSIPLVPIGVLTYISLNGSVNNLTTTNELNTVIHILGTIGISELANKLINKYLLSYRIENKLYNYNLIYNQLLALIINELNNLIQFNTTNTKNNFGLDENTFFTDDFNLNVDEYLYFVENDLLYLLNNNASLQNYKTRFNNSNSK